MDRAGIAKNAESVTVKTIGTGHEVEVPCWESFGLAFIANLSYFHSKIMFTGTTFLRNFHAAQIRSLIMEKTERLQSYWFRTYFIESHVELGAFGFLGCWKTLRRQIRVVFP